MNKIGVLVHFKADLDIYEKLKTIKSYGFDCCQIAVWDTSLYTDENAKAIKAAAEEFGVEISTLWCGWSGPKQWNFTAGPATLGIVPPAYRMKRAEELILGARFAAKIGTHRAATHVGFIPENMSDPEYSGIVAILKYVISAFAELNVNFLFETGQETPVALLRMIEEIGMDNVGINMDTANLILYGKANSADAISVFGKYVMDTHIKDGFYPTNGKELGREVKVGDGLANVPEVVARLKAVGYKGNYIIEREISGDQQTRDILETFDYLKKIID